MSVKYLWVHSPEGAARRFSQEIFKTLENMSGIEVIAYDPKLALEKFETLLKPEYKSFSFDIMDYQLLAFCVQEGVTHVLSGGLAPLGKFTLSLLRKMKIQTGHWFYEDAHQALYWREIAADYDDFFGIQKGHLAQEVFALGGRFHYLPVGARNFQSRETSGLLRWDCAFVGVPSTYRIQVLESLFHQGFKIAIAGEGWENYRGILIESILHQGFLEFEQSQILYREALISLCLSYEAPQKGPGEHQVSPRVFEIIAAGGLPLCEELDLLLELDLSLFTFKSSKELVNEIQRQKQSPLLRSAKIHFLQTQIQEKHKLENRLNQMLILLNKR